MTRKEALQVANPILFNTEMVRAILDGRKTVTRRVAFPNADLHEFKHKDYPNGWWYRGRAAKSWDSIVHCIEREKPCKYKIGDILYVRETWWRGVYGQYRYLANYDRPDLTKKQLCKEHKCRPSIHMPKEAARIFLRVTNIKVERLQDIDEIGVIDEGAEPLIRCPYEHIEYYPDGQEMCWNVLPCAVECDKSYPELFGELVWNETVKKSDLDKYGWAANPWVWVIEFERVEVTA